LAGAWFFFADVIQGFENPIIQESVSVIISELYIELYESLALSEYADRIEGFNFSEPAYEMLSFFEHFFIEMPILIPHRWEVDAWKYPQESLFIQEFIAFQGLTGRTEAFEEILISEYAELFFFYLTIVQEETVSVTDVLTNLFLYDIGSVVWGIDNVLIEESVELNTGDLILTRYEGDIGWVQGVSEDEVGQYQPSGLWYRRHHPQVTERLFININPPSDIFLFTALDHINVQEFRGVEYEPYSLVIFDIVLINEWEEVDNSLYLEVEEALALEEAVWFIFQPPRIQAFDEITVGDFNWIDWEPWYIDVLDEASVSDIGWTYIYLGDTLQPTQNIFIDEFVNLFLTGSAWYLGVAENFVIDEWVWQGTDPMPLSIFTDVSVFDIAWLTDIIIELGIIVDEVSVAEWTQPSLDILPSAVSEIIAIGEWINAFDKLLLPTFDSVVVQDLLVEGYIGINFEQFEAISIVENYNVVIEIIVSVEDFLSISEFVDQLADLFFMEAFTEISISEEVAFGVPSNVLAVDTVAIVEVPISFLDFLFVITHDGISLVDMATGTGHPLLFAFEILAVSEWSEFLVSPNVNVEDVLLILEWADLYRSPDVEVADSVTIIEQTAQYLDIWSFSVNSVITSVEIVGISLTELHTATFEGLTISDYGLPSIDPLRPSGEEIVGINEEIQASLPLLGLFSDEMVFLGEQADVSALLDLAVENQISITEYASVWDIIIELGIVFEELSLTESASGLIAHVLLISDDIGVIEDVEIYYGLQVDVFLSIGINEVTEQYIEISFSIESSINVQEIQEVSLDNLCIYIFEIASISDICYTILDYSLGIYDVVDISEWFVWGLPIQFIGVADDVIILEDNGIYIEPYELFPMLFGATERGF